MAKLKLDKITDVNFYDKEGNVVLHFDRVSALDFNISLEAGDITHYSCDFNAQNFDAYFEKEEEIKDESSWENNYRKEFTNIYGDSDLW